MLASIIRKIRAFLLILIMLILIISTFLVANYCVFYLASTEYRPDYKLPGKIEIIEGRAVHFIERGQGKPLIVVPDIGFSAESFSPVIDQLSTKYHVYIVDMIGQGYTDKPTDSKYSEADYNDFFNKFLAHIRLASSSFLAQGNSGFILRDYQKKYPDCVDRLVFLDHIKSRPILILDNNYLDRPLIGEALVTLINKSMLEGFIRNTGYYNSLLVENKTVEILVKYWGLPGVKLAYLKTIRTILGRPKLDNVYDKRDVFIYSERMLDVYPGELINIPPIHIIKKSGYFSYWENPDQFCQMIYRYI